MFSASTKAASGNVPAISDPQFNYVTMLLHGDGTNGAQNNTFLDSSTNNFTITRNGNTTQGSFSPYGSNWSNNFPTTSGDYLTIANNAAFTLGNTFTVECWLFRTASDDGTIVGRWYAGDSSGWLMHIFSGGKLAFGLGSGSYSNASASTIPLNTWTHLAVSNDTTSKRFYINGVLDATFSSDNCNSLGSINLTICQNTGGGYGIRSYISNLRIVKGTAVYTSNFTPPTAPLTAISGTSLLTCQSNRFIDNSTNNFTITPSGSPSVQRFNPFGASTAYSTSVIGGSGYFDGSGDYLNVGNPSVNSQLALGSNDFTIQAWVYPLGTGIYTILGSLNNSNGNGSYWLMVNGTFSGGGQIQFGYNYVSGGSGGNDVLFGTGTLPVNAWSFVAVTRSGSNLRGYVNGVQVGTTNTSIGSRTIYPTNQALYVGRNVDSDAYAMNGYLSDVQLVNGTALYTGSTMTVPTAPASPVTNTALLCNMTNGAIFDNAMMNDLETQGNAQISTSVKKYGTGSLYFDGSDVRLNIPTKPPLNITGDFTIEMWVYMLSLPSYSVLLDISANGAVGAGMTEIWIQSNGSASYYARGSILMTTTSSLITTGVWYHLAIVKSGTSQVLYVNGTNSASITSSTQPGFDLPYWIGDRPAGAVNGQYPLNGYIDDFRITNGYARYTANFTPPTAAFSNTGPY